MIIYFQEGLLMYTIEDLFDKRQVIGTKLEQLLLERSYTKTQFCKDSGISRPTLDKVLSGSITSQTNYEKHMIKILNCLSLTPDMILGNVQNPFIRANEIKKAMRISSEEIAQATGISIQRLREIESGKDAKTSELRDIALCLSTSVRGLLGTNFFETQVATMEVCLGAYNDNPPKDFGGFWGHIGLLPINAENFLWYPITGTTYKQIRQSKHQDFIVIPCMNNKVLLLNMQNIKELALLDEACDPPDFTEQDPSIDFGEIPLVVYESLEDYFYSDSHNLSPVFQTFLQKLTEKNDWDENTIEELTSIATFFFKDGKTTKTSIEFYEYENISAEISYLYDFGDAEFLDHILYYFDISGTELMINLNNISILELPLLKLEDAICRKHEEMYR